MQQERPDMDAGYGIATEPEGMVPWSWVQEQCERSRNYWVCTTRADGRPHAMPVWGLWLDDAVTFSTDPASVKARNFAARPDAVIHLESGDEVIILHGRITSLGEALHEKFVEQYDAKYGHRPSPEQLGDGGFMLRPERVLAWREADFPTSATRFRPG